MNESESDQEARVQRLVMLMYRHGMSPKAVSLRVFGWRLAAERRRLQAMTPSDTYTVARLARSFGMSDANWQAYEEGLIEPHLGFLEGLSVTLFDMHWLLKDLFFSPPQNVARDLFFVEPKA